MAAPWHNVFLGTETGFLKGVNIEKKIFKNLNESSGVDKNKEILAMCWCSDKEDKISLGLKNRQVQTLSTIDYGYVGSFECSGGTGNIKGMAINDDSIVTCVESGLVSVWTTEGKEKATLNAGDKIDIMRNNPQSPWLVATGGNENDLKVWDLQNPGEALFKAKNVKNDWLNLRVPVWVSDLQFIPDSKKIVTCTRHKQVRLYDHSCSQRRPLINIDFGEDPLTAVAVTHNENQVLVGSSTGTMALVDFRKGRMVQCYKGFAGGIRCIQCHPTLPLVASCGLDRHLRIHDTNTKELLHKVYLKSRLNCLLLRTEWTQEDEKNTLDSCSDVKKNNKTDNSRSDSNDGESDGDSDDDDDGLWNMLEKVGHKRTGRQENPQIKRKKKT
ncbi:WD repeat-containing protein 74 [Lingula anatina]|uniref:WD repeat-containing protein 74 n=1 Tax=Lingula anatina TaxID=7574 RepID=A0A1S3HAN6_LINAN|nr:WD repeat-containing protein 74 [Lingula anatina]|eukprot:XP_013382199.1 WD repeat-containing protein 74 [Lingula anatina]